MKTSGLPLQIAIVTVADLPEGTGRTSRLKTLVGALRLAHHHVTILVEHALSTTPGQQPSGVLAENGVAFEYVLEKTERSFGFASTLMKIRAVFAIGRRLRQMRRDNRLDIVIFNNLALYDALPLTLWANRNHVATIQCYEDDRQEIVSRHRIGLARRIFGLNSWLADRVCPRLADAIIVISGYLEKKYRRLNGNRCPVFLIPPIIDCELWHAPAESETDCPILLYAGAFAEHDEIELVIEALALLRQRGRNFRLTLIGADPKFDRIRSLNQLITELDMEDCIEVHGFRPLSVVREAVFASNILINLRRDSVWSRSGQSTKLSECLASGRLVIASRVGDNSKYLLDGESALLTTPTAPAEELAAVIEPALLSSELRRRIGHQGRAVALMSFDQHTVSTRLDHIVSMARNRAEASKKRRIFHVARQTGVRRNRL